MKVGKIYVVKFVKMGCHFPPSYSFSFSLVIGPKLGGLVRDPPPPLVPPPPPPPLPCFLPPGGGGGGEEEDREWRGFLPKLGSTITENDSSLLNQEGGHNVMS